MRCHFFHGFVLRTVNSRRILRVSCPFSRVWPSSGRNTPGAGLCWYRAQQVGRGAMGIVLRDMWSHLQQTQHLDMVGAVIALVSPQRRALRHG